MTFNRYRAGDSVNPYFSAFAIVACLLFAPPRVLGQTSAVEDGASTARVHWGPLRVNPTFALTNIGVDGNVFNAADANHPQSDFTATLTPGADAWFRAGRSVVAVSAREDLVYYREFATERSINGYYSVTATVPVNRLSWKIGGDYLSARDRPGFEIDARSLHTEGGVHGGAEARMFGKTFVAATVRRATIKFDQDAVFMGASLQQELSREVTTADVAVRHQLTPVTGVIVDVSRENDRFLYNSERDSASTRIMGRVRFATRLHGDASLGYRSFEPRDSSVPVFRGLTANADVSFATVGSTRLGVQVVRDVDYSYDIQQPYYIQTGATASFTRGLFGPLSGSARIGWQQLAYRGRIALMAAVPDRTDLVSLLGGSISYRVAGGTRVFFNVDKQQRNSDIAGHSYGGLRYGTSVMYGF